MEVLEALVGRRSVRGFKDEQITDEQLNAILEAGMYAASGMNRQPSTMIVVQDKETIAKLSKMNAAVMGKEGIDPFYNAQTIIVVLVNKDVPTCVEDGSLVMGNLMNAAYGVGVSSCWIHRAKEVFESEEGKALLEKWGVKGELRGVGHCALGYAKDEVKPAGPRKEGYVVRV